MRFFITIALVFASLATLGGFGPKAEAQDWVHRGIYRDNPAFPGIYSRPRYHPPIHDNAASSNHYTMPNQYAIPSYSSAPYAAPFTLTTIGVHDNVFSARTIVVPIGARVQWINYGTRAHTVTSRAGAFESGELLPGRSFAVTFDRPGVYYYYCRHRPQSRMEGTIVVGEGGYASGASY